MIKSADVEKAALRAKSIRKSFRGKSNGVKNSSPETLDELAEKDIAAKRVKQFESLEHYKKFLSEA